MHIAFLSNAHIAQALYNTFNFSSLSHLSFRPKAQLLGRTRWKMLCTVTPNLCHLSRPSEPWSPVSCFFCFALTVPLDTGQSVGEVLGWDINFHQPILQDLSRCTSGASCSCHCFHQIADGFVHMLYKSCMIVIFPDLSNNSDFRCLSSICSHRHV